MGGPAAVGIRRAIGYQRRTGANIMEINIFCFKYFFICLHILYFNNNKIERINGMVTSGYL